MRFPGRRDGRNLSERRVTQVGAAFFRGVGRGRERQTRRRWEAGRRLNAMPEAGQASSSSLSLAMARLSSEMRRSSAEKCTSSMIAGIMMNPLSQE